jgi:membrane protein required for beta-lactamase induction
MGRNLSQWFIFLLVVKVAGTVAFMGYALALCADSGRASRCRRARQTGASGFAPRGVDRVARRARYVRTNP